MKALEQVVKTSVKASMKLLYFSLDCHIFTLVHPKLFSYLFTQMTKLTF